jgi:hypothetical protein
MEERKKIRKMEHILLLKNSTREKIIVTPKGVLINGLKKMLIYQTNADGSHPPCGRSDVIKVFQSVERLCGW